MGARHRSAKTNARSDKLPINRRDKHLDNRACISEWHASHHRRTQYNIIRSYIHTHTHTLRFIFVFNRPVDNSRLSGDVAEHVSPWPVFIISY